MLGSGAPSCPRCLKRVYYAEQTIALGKNWHVACFSCAECNRRLDSRICTDHDGEAFCKHCYGKLFGPKGFGFGIGAGSMSSDPGSPVTPVSPPPFSRSLIAASLNDSSQLEQGDGPDPFPPSPPITPVENGSAYAKLGLTDLNRKTNRKFSDNIATPMFGSATERCRRCNKAVYMAEKIMAAGYPWHKMTCFCCTLCNKKLESTNLCERENDIYCKTCYGRNYGPKGYGFGVGAGALQMQQ